MREVLESGREVVGRGDGRGEGGGEVEGGGGGRVVRHLKCRVTCK